MDRRSLALVCSSDERGAVIALAERFRGLLERGWDAQLVFDGFAAAQHADCPELDTADVTGRVHLSPAHRRGRVASWARRGSTGRGLVGRPSATWGYLRAGGRPKLSPFRGQDVES